MIRRRVFTILSAVPLVLCVATAVLWVRSYFASDGIGHNGRLADWYVSNLLGQIRFGHTVAVDSRVIGIRSHVRQGWHLDSGTPERLERVPGANAYVWAHGFGLVTGERWGDYHYELLIPQWFVAALTLVVPALWVLSRCRRVFPSSNVRCTCGYDLRATPDQCPECGRAVTTKRTMPAT